MSFIPLAVVDRIVVQQRDPPPKSLLIFFQSSVVMPSEMVISASLTKEPVKFFPGDFAEKVQAAGKVHDGVLTALR